MMSQRALCKLAKVLEGLPVLGCLDGRPAARAGIRYGDVLLAVNGRRTRSFVDYLEARELRTDGMDVVVFRNGQEHHLVLPFGEGDERASGDNQALLRELAAKRIEPRVFGGSEPEAS